MEQISNMLNTQFRGFDFKAPSISRKQQIYSRYHSRINQDVRNEHIKSTLVKWCSNVRSNNPSFKEFRSLDTPTEVTLVQNTLRSLIKVSPSGIYITLIYLEM